MSSPKSPPAQRRSASNASQRGTSAGSPKRAWLVASHSSGKPVACERAASSARSSPCASRCRSADDEPTLDAATQLGHRSDTARIRHRARRVGAHQRRLQQSIDLRPQRRFFLGVHGLRLKRLTRPRVQVHRPRRRPGRGQHRLRRRPPQRAQRQTAAVGHPELEEVPRVPAEQLHLIDGLRGAAVLQLERSVGRSGMSSGRWATPASITAGR